MRFQVPQYIEVEDKIFGPLTFKQFIYLLGGAGLSYVLWELLPSFIAILLILPVVGFSLALAFYKVNKKPFIYIVEAAIKFVTGTKLYVWKKEQKAKKTKEEKAQKKEEENSGVTIPRLSQSKLEDISWSLGIQNSVEGPQSGESEDSQDQ